MSEFKEKESISDKKSYYKLLNSKKDFENLIRQIIEKGFCAIDLETNSLNIEKANLVGISLCCDQNNAYYIPINHLSKETSSKIKNQLDQNYILKKIKIICENPAILKIGQKITITQIGNIESLNVSVACGIILNKLTYQ